MPQGLAKLFIGQLNFDASEEDVRQLFDYYGDVMHVNVLRDKQSRKSTGSAFVTYGCTEVLAPSEFVSQLGQLGAA